MEDDELNNDYCNNYLQQNEDLDNEYIQITEIDEGSWWYDGSKSIDDKIEDLTDLILKCLCLKH